MALRPMHLALAGLLSVLCVDAASAHATTQSFGSAESGCSVDSAYTLRIEPNRVQLDADATDVRPRRVAIRDGALWIDGDRTPVSDADAARLRGIEAQTRDMVPAIAGITRDAIGITFDTLASVNHALTGSRRQARDFDRLRERAMTRIDATLGRGIWSPELFGDAFEDEIEAAAEAMAANFTTRRALWMVMTGGVGRMERRMEKMEASLEQSIEAREGRLEAHATALCRQLRVIEGLQDAMELRLDDGRPLRLFEIRRRGSDASEGMHASKD